jgi:hypothetical protein
VLFKEDWLEVFIPGAFSLMGHLRLRLRSRTRYQLSIFTSQLISIDIWLDFSPS